MRNCELATGTVPVLYCTGYRVLVCCSVTCFEILYTGSGSWALSMCDMLINPDLEATPSRSTFTV